MAETPASDNKFNGGFGRGARPAGDRPAGDRPRGPRPSGPRGGPRRGEKEEWVPVTKLGRLVKDGKVRTLEEIYAYALPIREYQIIEHFLGDKLTDEVMKIMPVQKQTTAGQRTRFKAFVLVGDKNGHVGLGVKSSKEAATAIRAALNKAKVNVFPVRRGYWGSRMGNPHTVPGKVSGKCGSVRFRLVPAPRGTGLVAARVPSKVLQLAGIDDVFTSASGHTSTEGNFLKATIQALRRTYSYLTPDLWESKAKTTHPYQEFTDFLRDYNTQKKSYAPRAPRPERR